MAKIVMNLGGCGLFQQLKTKINISTVSEMEYKPTYVSGKYIMVL